MIIKPKTVASFPVTSAYALQEDDPEKKPRVLAAHGVRTDCATHMAEDFDAVRAMRPGLGKAVFHVVIALPPQESARATDDLLRDLARDYMKEMRISATNTQWALVRHTDKDHPHLHLLINRVDLNGLVVSDHFCRKRSLEASRCLEQRYELTQAEQVGRQQGRAIGPTPAQSRAETPQQKRRADWSRARHTIGRVLDYTRNRATDFTELSQHLRPHGIDLHLRLGENGVPTGVVFVLDGHRVKGSQLGQQYGAGRLLACFAQTREASQQPVPDRSLHTLGSDYKLAKVLTGYAQAKQQARENAHQSTLTPDWSRGIGE